jgi:hypothetical protein
MSGDANVNRPLFSYILTGIVDFVCILMAAESFRDRQFFAATVWLVAGIVSALIGYHWPKLRSRMAAVVKAWSLPEESDVERLTGECERLKQQYDLAVRTSDQTQQENRELRDKLGQREERIGQLLDGIQKSKLETDEIYADVIFSWLRDHIKTTGTFSVASLAQSVGLTEDAVIRGLGLLKTRYQIVTQRSPDVDAWSFVAGATPFVPRYRIVPANRPRGRSPKDEARDLSDDLHAFLKELGPCPSPKKAPGEDDLEFLRNANSQIGPWCQRLVAGWAGRFADRASKTRHLLAEHNVVDFELDRAIDAAKSETNILHIADKFLLLSSRVNGGI